MTVPFFGPQTLGRDVQQTAYLEPELLLSPLPITQASGGAGGSTRPTKGLTWPRRN